MGTEPMESHPLTHVRRQRDWSMEHLARLLTLAAQRRGLVMKPGRDRIYRWEHRRATQGEDYQMLLADVLGVGHSDVAHAGWPWWLPAYDVPRPFTAGGTHAALTEVMVAVERSDRRAFLALTGGVLSGPARDWATVEPRRLTGALDGRRVDATLLTWLEVRTDELRTLANTSAPECAPLVHAFLGAAVQLTRNGSYDGATARRLLHVVAATAQCAAWLHFDQGEHARAQRYWHGALHAAHRADDRDLGAGLLSDLAYSATWLKQPAAAVAILEHALSRARSPAVRSLLHVRSARASASLGDHHSTERALSSAEGNLEKAVPGTTPAWVSWMSAADLRVDAGRCWFELGRQARSERALTEGLDLLDPARMRTRSLVLSYGAEVALARHDLPTAATQAREALRLARSTQASRCVKLVDATVDRFAAHRQHASVADLYAYAGRP